MADHKKEVIVAELKEQLASAKGAVFTTYTGLTVAQDTELRRELRAAGVTYHVVKNTMLRRAADALGIEGLDPQAALEKLGDDVTTDVTTGSGDENRLTHGSRF